MRRRPILIPSLFMTTINMGLMSLDNMLFSSPPKACPVCGGRPGPYDTKEKIYANIITDTGINKINVRVRRFKCRDCGTLIYADEPFYPNTRVGSVIIDTALSLSSVNSYSKTAKIMNTLGIDINRGTVRNYALSNLPMQKSGIFYGLRMPATFVSLISKSAAYSQTIDQYDVLELSRYPSYYHPPKDGKGTASEFFKNKTVKFRDF
ncbi:MAG TPA: hypothetical protein O0W90_01735 [Methanocorpusculum sp.]|nr:hypothetical protein [Methanocorpusculum sp.]